MNKKLKLLLIVLVIAILAGVTVFVLINKILEPETTSKELFSKVNYGIAQAFSNLGNYQATMVDVIENEFSTYIDEEQQTVDMSKSERYTKAVNEIVTECDGIISYDTKGLSKTMLEYVKYAKTVATEMKEFYQNSLKETSVTEYDENLNQYMKDFTQTKMPKLTELLNKATEEVMGEENQNLENETK